MQISPSNFRQSLLEIGIGSVPGGISLVAIWLAIVVASTPPANSAPLVLSSTTAVEKIADVGDAAISAEARQIANWVAKSSDNRELDFVIIDKKNAAVHVFNADAHLLGSSPVLLGFAVGDDSVPGIGSRPINKIAAAERTTPAGRFIAERGRNIEGEDIIWIDYDAAVSMHRVRATNKAERRLARLATPTSDDNRISYGCINVPVRFYETYIQPLFIKNNAVVYVLPEVKSLTEVFGMAASVVQSTPRAMPALPALP
jgi:hypothetical protein